MMEFWTSVVAGVVSGLVAGLVLWMILPRGVVLTRKPKPPGSDGQPQYNMWEVRNESSLPIRITGVTYCGVDTFNPQTKEIEIRELSPDAQPQDCAVSLTFDDETAELTRDDSMNPWSEQLVPPGDTLTAYVNLNRKMTIKYRRQGLAGMFERRQIQIHGGV